MALGFFRCMFTVPEQVVLMFLLSGPIMVPRYIYIAMADCTSCIGLPSTLSARTLYLWL